jgi:hypothetical protein
LSASLSFATKSMPSPNFYVRSEYRAPRRDAFNDCGTEGVRAPGNLPRICTNLRCSNLPACVTSCPNPKHLTLSTVPLTRTPRAWHPRASDGMLNSEIAREGKPSPPGRSRLPGTPTSLVSSPEWTSYSSKVVGWSRMPQAYSEDAYDEGFM